MKTKDAIKVSISIGHKDFKELLEDIKKLSSHIVEDIEKSSECDSQFSIGFRKNQVRSLVALTNDLNLTLYKISELESKLKV